MSECKLDHSLEDVRKKLEDQSFFLPEEVYTGLKNRLQTTLEQATLNDIFHLLKKYDLASEKERLERDKQIKQHL